MVLYFSVYPLSFLDGAATTGPSLLAPIVGVLTSRIDSRWLMATGFVTFSVASFKPRGN